MDMDQETVLPSAEADASAVAGDQAEQAQLPDGQTEGNESEADQKPEKHPLEKELAKERRRISRLVEQREQARAEAAAVRQQLGQYRQPAQSVQTDDSGDNIGTDDRVTLTPAQLKELIIQQAQRLAPDISSQQAKRAELVKAANNLKKELGADFDTVAEDLGHILKSEDLQYAVLSSDAPAEMARYLTDPDNADEAEKIGRMSPIQAGRAFARIEAKLMASKSEKTPQRSSAPGPLESVRAVGTSASSAPDPMNTKAWMKWRNEQDRRAR